MKKRYFLYLILFLFSCQSNNGQKRINQDSLNSADTAVFTGDLIDTSSLGLIFKLKRNYTASKNYAASKKDSLLTEYNFAHSASEKDKIINEARIIFTDLLLNEIVPHWYGTIWDFNGYTESPNQGVIACGYFVSTTLLHIGINLNRYKFAQQWGINEAKTLEADSLIEIYELEGSYQISNLIDELEKKYKDGLYFVGLSNHVGYIYAHENTLYFLHSNYIDGFVMIEKARFSEAFRSYIYVIADITYNDELIKKWLTGEYIKTVTQ